MTRYVAELAYTPEGTQRLLVNGGKPEKERPKAAIQKSLDQCGSLKLELRNTIRQGTNYSWRDRPWISIVFILLADS